MKGRAIPAAYTDTGAGKISCPHCGAQAGQPCIKPSEEISRVPCVARLAAADLTPATVDFSEPRHPRGEAS